MTEPLRVVSGEDDVLLREGIAHRPDVAVVDVQMPPGRADDGLRAAVELRRQRPATGVLVLSQFYEEYYAVDLIGEHAEGVGCLLKERVGDVDAFIDAVTLGLVPTTSSEHRRGLAVLTYLRSAAR